MGLDLVHAAYRCTSVQGSAKSVLSTLAVLAREKLGGWCWPSVEWIARAVGRSIRQVQRALAELAAHGLVEVLRGSGRGRFSRYRVALERVTSAPPGTYPGAPDAEWGDYSGGASGERVTPCGQPEPTALERVTSCPKKGDMVSPRKKDEKKKNVAMSLPVDKSGPWARGFSHLSGFCGTSSCASSAPGAPCRPGGSPLAGLPPCTTTARSTTASAGSSSVTSSDRSGPGSVAELVAQFLGERRGQPGW